MTTSVLPATLRETILDKTDEVEALVSPAASEDEHPERELEERTARRWDWYRDLEDHVLEVTDNLPAHVEDYEARKLLELMTELRRLIEADEEMRAESEIQLVCAKILDVLERMVRAIEHTELEDPESAARFIFRSLEGVPVSDLVELLDVSDKTIGAWRRGGAVRTNQRRVELVAQLCSYLRHSHSRTGLLMWFRAPADLLDGNSPLEILGTGDPSPAAWHSLIGFARGARGQLAG